MGAHFFSGAQVSVTHRICTYCSSDNSKLCLITSISVLICIITVFRAP